MVHIVLNEYPEEATLIAESYIKAVPEKAHIVKAAFQSVPDPDAAQKDVEAELPSVPQSPIEKFLQTRKKRRKRRSGGRSKKSRKLSPNSLPKWRAKPKLSLPQKLKCPRQ